MRSALPAIGYLDAVTIFIDPIKLSQTANLNNLHAQYFKQLANEVRLHSPD